MSEVLPNNFGKNYEVPFEPLDLMSHLERVSADPQQRFLYHQRQGALEGSAVILLTPDHANEVIGRMATYELKSKLFDPNALYVGLLRGGNQFAVRYASAIAEEAIKLKIRHELPDFGPLGVHPHVHYMNAGRYGSSQHGTNKLDILQRLPDSERTAGRIINACDDVVDEGITLQLLDPYFINGLRRIGLLRLRKEGPSKSFGVRAFCTKGIGELVGIDRQNIVIGCEGPNVWFTEMGMDGQRTVVIDGEEIVQKEINRHPAGLSVPLVQDLKYEDEMKLLMRMAIDLNLTSAKMSDLRFIDTSRQRRTRSQRIIDFIGKL